jgi:hypothetical protein
MLKVKVVWKIHEGPTPEEVWHGSKASDMIGYQEIGCHMVFNVHMDFTCKARFVARGHTTEAATCLYYLLSVVSCKSV